MLQAPNPYPFLIQHLSPPCWIGLLGLISYLRTSGDRWVESVLAGAVAAILLVPAFVHVLVLVGFAASLVAAGPLAACCNARLGLVAQ